VASGIEPPASACGLGATRAGDAGVAAIDGRATVSPGGATAITTGAPDRGALPTRATTATPTPGDQNTVGQGAGQRRATSRGQAHIGRATTARAVTAVDCPAPVAPRASPAPPAKDQLSLRSNGAVHPG
jgi:hypothetical protein